MNIKTTAASLKKLLNSMLDHGWVSAADRKEALETIKSDLPDWRYKCALYNDPNLEWEDIAGEFGMRM